MKWDEHRVDTKRFGKRNAAFLNANVGCFFLIRILLLFLRTVARQLDAEEESEMLTAMEDVKGFLVSALNPISRTKTSKNYLIKSYISGEEERPASGLRQTEGFDRGTHEGERERE